MNLVWSALEACWIISISFIQCADFVSELLSSRQIDLAVYVLLMNYAPRTQYTGYVLCKFLWVVELIRNWKGNTSIFASLTFF